MCAGEALVYHDSQSIFAALATGREYVQFVPSLTALLSPFTFSIFSFSSLSCRFPQIDRLLCDLSANVNYQ